MKELSTKDKKIKESMEKTLASSEQTFFGRYRWFFGLLPSDPRCASCLAPFEGKGGAFVRTVLNKRRAQMNPLFCNFCEDAAKRTHAGVEVEMSMLFADIRGSTPLAESMSASEFKRVIERFYTETTKVLTQNLAQIDKLAGDEVSGFFIPAFIGKEYVRRSVEAAQEILRVTGHTAPEGPWAPVGVGINTGKAYFGVVGEGEELVEITALGDAVNVAARLGSQAAAGEIMLSESTFQMAGLEKATLEKRTLSLKGKSQPMNVWVLRAEDKPF